MIPAVVDLQKRVSDLETLAMVLAVGQIVTAVALLFVAATS